MSRPRSWLDRVAAARQIPILEIARRLGLGSPRRVGSQSLVRCPLHQDRRPSLCLDAKKGVWFCHPCGEGGDGIKLVMRARRVSFKEAIHELVL